MREKTSETWRTYDAALNAFIEFRRGDPAVERFIHHPDELFARAFLRKTRGVDCYGIDRVYLHTKRTLARRIDAGEIGNLEQLRTAALGVLGMNAFHHACLAWRRDHPTVAATANGRDATLPLFVTGLDVTNVPAPRGTLSGTPRPEWTGAERLRVARALGPVLCRVVHHYLRCERDRGTGHGADTRIARLAVLGGTGRVVGFRPWRTPVEGLPEPAVRVVRQVRKLRREALDRLRAVLSS